MTMELMDSEVEETAEGCNDRERDESSEKWFAERYTATMGQASPKGSPSNNEPSNNQPVSSDQAARGGRGRKRKNPEINKKV